MSTKKALITGITGQDGSYLAEFLLGKGYEVHGLKRRSSSFNTGRIDHFYNREGIYEDKMFLHFGDMTDSLSLNSLLSKIKPDEIYNLAAQSHVKVSFETPEYTANADGLGTLRLLEAIRFNGLVEKTKFYQAGTSELYGKVKDRYALDENSPFIPQSPYACAKLFAHWITVNYREAYGLFASNGILFNHESPRRGDTFVTKKITNAIIRQIMGDRKALVLGNIYATRDWGHARDYVEGMWRMLQLDQPGDYVLANETCSTVKQFLISAYNKVGLELVFEGEGLNEKGKVASILSDKQIKHDYDLAPLVGHTVIEISPEYFRPTEVDFLLGNAAKARQKLNWSPKYSLDDLICDMLSSGLEMINGN